MRRAVPSPPAQRPALPVRSQADRAGIVASLLRFAEALSRHAYLEQRGLSPATLTDPRFKSTVLTDPRGAAVFPHYDQLGVCGYEIKHTGITGFAKGGQKGIWYTSNIDTAPRIVVVESAIDGLSHAQIQGDPDTAYLSTAGSLSDAQIELFRTAFLRATQRGATIVLATDADPAGDELATKLHALAPPGVVVLRERPSAKDWNDLLQQRVRDYSRPRRGLS